VHIQWLGHAAFLVVSPQGTRILIDPFPPSLGYSAVRVPATAVLLSNRNFDHKYVAMAEGTPRVIPGLTLEGKCTEVRTQVGDVTIRGVCTWQDAEQGAQRGANSMWLITVGGLRILHAGSLGHLLEAETVRALGPVDVLLVPVGGIYTLDGDQAARLVEQLKPHIAVPMHYKTPAMRLQLEKADKFLKHFPDYTTAPHLSLERASLPAATRVYVLRYEASVK
jgi:L-ascorbate metabolism protein UlaG (beta-lactamase superfamily)